MDSKAQCRDAALQMHRAAQQVMNEPNVIFYPKWALMISVKKKEEKVFMATYGPLGISGDVPRGQSPLVLALCSHTLPGCVAESISCITKPANIPKV